MRGMPSVSDRRAPGSRPAGTGRSRARSARMPTSAESGRMSVVPRPSMRTPSLTMRLRTTSFCSERNACLTSLGLRRRTCPGSSSVPTSASSDALEDLVEAVVAVGLVGDRHRLATSLARGLLGHRRRTRRSCSRRSASYAIGCDRAVRLDDLGAQLDLQLDRRRDPLLRLFEALGDDLFGDLRRALFVELPRGLGATGLDHHDRDVAVVELATGDDDLERRLVALLERRVRDPLAVVVREAHRADRAVERDARDRERGRRAVDRQRRRAGSRGRRRGWWR